MRTQTILSLALLCGVLYLTSVESECQKCNAHDVYCVDETSYHLCLDGQNPWTNQLFHCDEGKVCTASSDICEPSKGANNVPNTPSCAGACAKCPAATEANNRYACVSRTQFSRCVNGETTIVGNCESGSICSSELYAQTGVICAPQCVTDFYKVSATCANDVITTTTTTTTARPPVDVNNLKMQCQAAAANHPNAKFFHTKNLNDDECTTYIYCEKYVGDDWDALLLRCKGGYFDSAQGKCVADKPAECEPEIGSGFLF